MGIHPVEFEVKEQFLARHIAGQACRLGARGLGRRPRCLSPRRRRHQEEKRGQDDDATKPSNPCVTPG